MKALTDLGILRMIVLKQATLDKSLKKCRNVVTLLKAQTLSLAAVGNKHGQNEQRVRDGKAVSGSKASFVIPPDSSCSSGRTLNW